MTKRSHLADPNVQIDRVLGALLGACRARVVILVLDDRTWHAASGEPMTLDADALSAALAQLVGAAAEVAGVLGDRSLSLLLRENERGHVHVEVEGPWALAVAFDEYGLAGRVRQQARRAAGSIRSFLGTPATDDAAQQQREDVSFARELIDRIFANE